ncbi:DUF6240 domain-containing protein [Lachnospiraceae bacterium ZAX-1]
MRVDNTKIMELVKPDAHVEAKGKPSLTSIGESTRTVSRMAWQSHRIQRTSVEKSSNTIEHMESKLEQIKQDAQAEEIKRLKNNMGVLANTISKDDYSQLESDGISLNDTDVKKIVTQMDKIKMELAKAGTDISIFGDSISREQLESMGGSQAQVQQMAQILKNHDLPLTQENQEDAQKALKQADSLVPCNDGTIKFMLDNELEPTIANVYKAQHSGGSANKQEDITVDEKVEQQMKKLIASAGLSVNETTMADSKWMLYNGIPLTEDNLKYMETLKNLELPVSDHVKLMETMAEAVAQGKRPQDAWLTKDDGSLQERAIQAMQLVEQAKDTDLQYVIDHNLPLTIENLGKSILSEQIEIEQANQKGARLKDAGSNTDILTKDNQAADVKTVINDSLSEIRSIVIHENLVINVDKFVTARRQLEEARLAMTAQANYALLKQGISIETQPLEQLVEQLKAAEEQYINSMFTANAIEPTSKDIALFQEVEEKTENLKQLPAYALGFRSYHFAHANIETIQTVGATQRDGEIQTIETLHESGMQLKADLEKAGTAYETLMTSPRADMGDSIQKAFQNVEDILADIELSNTQENQRAVRILGYNQLEITQESVLKMKAEDQKVQLLFENLTPSVVMQMIHEGVNPLTMDINQLNAKAEEIKADLGIGEEEKFSKYLRQLEQKQEVTPKERSTYIGIYRLLHQVEQTDGAIIGALLNQGADLTMKNLLTAVRSGKAQGIDVALGENYQGVDYDVAKNNITDQIQASYQTDCAKEALQRLTPQRLAQLSAEGDLDELTPEQLLQQLRNSKSQQESELDYQNQLKEFATTKDVEDVVLRILTEHEMPITTYNMLAANNMLNKRNTVFSQLFKYDPEAQNEEVDLEPVKQKILEDFAEALKTPEEMAKAHKALADKAENVMKTMINTERIQSDTIRNLKILRQEIALSTQMAKEEHYAIPVLVADEMTNVQLKIVRGTKEKGRVDVLFETPELGKVVAQIRVEPDKISGYIASDLERTVQRVKEREEEFLTSVNQDETRQVQLNYVHSQPLDLTHFSLNSSRKDGARVDESSSRKDDVQMEENNSYEVQTKALYGLAKSFIDMVKRLK